MGFIFPFMGQALRYRKGTHTVANTVFVCLFFAGGSVSNMYAMNLARYKFCPEIKEKGLSGLPRLVLFASEEVK